MGGLLFTSLSFRLRDIGAHFFESGSRDLSFPRDLCHSGRKQGFDFKEMEELFHVPLRVWSALITHEKIDDMDSLPFFNFSRRVFSFHMQDLFHFL